MRRTKQEALETRAAILDAAETVFYERGVGQTTLAQIAAEAKVTRGAIYWHFANKAELFKAMQDRVRLPQEEFFQSREILAAERCLDALHQTTIEALNQFASDERAQRVYTIILLRCEYVGEMREALVRSDEVDAAMRRMIHNVFERAAERRQLRSAWTPDIATRAYICAFVGLFTEWLSVDGGFDLLETAEPLMASLFASFSAEG